MVKNLKKKKNNKGFTLVELLVVIAIIGILAVVAVPSLFTQIEKSKVASLESDISAIKSVSIAKYADSTLFPSGTTPTTGDTVANLLSGEIDGLANKFEGTYTIKQDATTDDIIIVVSGVKFSDKAQETLAKDLGLTDGDSTGEGKNGFVNATGLTYILVDVKKAS